MRPVQRYMQYDDKRPTGIYPSWPLSYIIILSCLTFWHFMPGPITFTFRKLFTCFKKCIHIRIFSRTLVLNIFQRTRQIKNEKQIFLNGQNWHVFLRAFMIFLSGKQNRSYPRIWNVRLVQYFIESKKQRETVFLLM